MTPHSRRSRVAWLGLLLLQLFAVGVVPALDAQVEASAYGAVAHVEEPGRTDCPLAHDQEACSLCRVLRSAGPPATTGHAAYRAVSDPQPPSREIEGCRTAAIGVAARPRAPPR
ncbi:MAG: hypothetical protein JNL26_03575 [Gemmatimonadetes bacterium]|nr:hypothetical protein [Gemmatimonadota bacterium]